MKSTAVHIGLRTSADQLARLRSLQAMFAQACNALAPLVQSTRCWNRVALHHMAYKQLREQFPELGSQMICNTIYSVSRISRLAYQHPKSPFNIAKWGDLPLARLHFVPHAPVYFDRHTLSLKDGVVSMFTLDGRMRFDLNLPPTQERRFREGKLREIVLSGGPDNYKLSFVFGSTELLPVAREADDNWPEYVLITDRPTAAPKPLANWLGAPLGRSPQGAKAASGAVRAPARQASRPRAASGSATSAALAARATTLNS